MNAGPVSAHKPAAPHPDLALGTEFLADLRAALPDLRLLTTAADVEAHRWDETEYMHPGHPLGVAFTRSTADVATTLTLAARHS